jgi:hypothetical protein
MELEAEAERLRAIERGSIAAAGEARGSRERSFVEMAKEGTGTAASPEGVASGKAAEGECAAGDDGRAGWGGWREAETLWEAAVRRRDGFEAMRPAQEGLVERARAEFLAGRRERLQAEALVAAAAAGELLERGRKEQRGLDDWFQSWAQRIGDRDKDQDKR